MTFSFLRFLLLRERERERERENEPAHTCLEES
jgi:hypothetical protein